jgi:hypothetical protein
MKNLLLVLITVFSCSAMYAGAVEKIEILSAKVILQNTEGYFALSDGTCLKAIGFSKRFRTPSEWWNNVQLVPENYECIPNDWFLGTEIEVYSKYDNLEVNEANASNQEELKQCTHLLFNTRNGQVLFAIMMHPSECLIQLFNDAHKDGYNKGYREGSNAQHKNSNDIYDSGYAEGYKEGYAEGYQAGH